MLDEATSSLSEEDEHYFYSVLHQMGTTVLSVGHRSTIKQVCVSLHVTTLEYNYYLLVSSSSTEFIWTWRRMETRPNVLIEFLLLILHNEYALKSIT